MDLPRRTFLGLAAGGLLARWGAAAVGSQEFALPADTVGAAWYRAERSGRPLLILDSRGDGVSTWGSLLGRGPRALMAELALCEVALANAPRISGRGRWWRDVVDRLDYQATTALIVNPELERARVVELPFGIDYWEHRDVRVLEHRVERLAPILANAITGHGDVVLFELARRCREKLSRRELERIEEDLATGSGPRSSDVRRAPALVRFAAEAYPQRRVWYMDLLGQLGEERYRVGAPAGARWGRLTGPCGEVQYEDGTCKASGPCGTGFPSPAGRRFLSLYTT